MVRKYIRKTNRCSWSEKNMENAIKAVRDGTMGYLKAAKEFKVPKTTLKRRCKGQNAKATEASKVRTRLYLVLPLIILYFYRLSAVIKRLLLWIKKKKLLSI